MIISKKAVEIIKLFEGFKSKPYRDSKGVPTIGFGTTIYPNGKKVKMTDPPITRQKGEQLLLSHLNREVMPYIDRFIDVPITQNQIDALASLVYNIGWPQFKASSIRRKINNNDPIQTHEASFKAWKRSGGKVIQGLVNRRAKEWALYIK